MDLTKKNLSMNINSKKLLLEQIVMQAKHEIDQKYKATTCVDKIEGWCFLDLYSYHLIELSKISSTF
jgi:hypothetical protein